MRKRNLLFRLGTVIVFTTLLSACATGSRQATAPASTIAPPAIIPQGSRMHDTQLDLTKWKLTKGLRINKIGPNGRLAVTYVGTGSPTGNEAATREVAVSPGKIYVFSASADPSKIVKGQFDLIIDTANGRSAYTMLFRGVGSKGKYQTLPWLCPAGTTRVLLGMQLVGTVVAKGATLTFTGPVLSEAIPPKYQS